MGLVPDGTIDTVNANGDMIMKTPGLSADHRKALAALGAWLFQDGQRTLTHLVNNTADTVSYVDTWLELPVDRNPYGRAASQIGEQAVETFRRAYPKTA